MMPIMGGMMLQFSCTNEALVTLSMKRKALINIPNGLSKKT